jgi:hypothetical protein
MFFFFFFIHNLSNFELGPISSSNLKEFLNKKGKKPKKNIVNKLPLSFSSLVKTNKENVTTASSWPKVI